MIPAAFGVILAALETLDTDLDPDHLDDLAADDLAAMWRQASAICRAADGLYDKLRRTLASEIANASHQTEATS